MTVKELINFLKKFDAEIPVLIGDSCYPAGVVLENNCMVNIDEEIGTEVLILYGEAR
jgi:hypothetical protein